MDGVVADSYRFFFAWSDYFTKKLDEMEMPSYAIFMNSIGYGIEDPNELYEFLEAYMPAVSERKTYGTKE